MFLDTSFGHPYQNVCVPGLVEYFVNAAVSPPVQQNVSSVLSGGAEGTFVQAWDGDASAMTTTSPANVLVDSPFHFATFKLERN